jgi:hypothetical protein
VWRERERESCPLELLSWDDVNLRLVGTSLVAT